MYIPIWLIVSIVVVLLLFYRGKQKQEEFSPIRIGIEAKWAELFKDYKVANDNSWDNKVPEGKEYHVLKRGINFTILKPGLIYDDDYHHFQTEVDIQREIEEVSPSVGFYVKHAIEGYEIGLITFESRRKSYMPGDGLECIKVATIPYSEFVFYGHNKKNQEERDKNLQKYGWTRQEPDAELSLVCHSVILEHKYFLADYEYI